MTAYQSIAYEYSAEMTYPLPEGTSGGLVNWVSQVQSYNYIAMRSSFVQLTNYIKELYSTLQIILDRFSKWLIDW